MPHYPGSSWACGLGGATRWELGSVQYAKCQQGNGSQRSCEPLPRGCSDTRLAGADPLAGRVELFDLGLLAPQFFVDRLDVIRTNFFKGDFLDDARRFVDQSVFGRLDDLDLVVGPVDIRERLGIAEGLADDLGMFLMQRYLFLDISLGGETANPGPTALDLFLADLQLFLGKAQYIAICGRELWCNGDGLGSGQRHRGDLLCRRLDTGCRRHSSCHGAIGDVDRVVQIEDAGGMR